jgi:RNA-directed DNA polymerase
MNAAKTACASSGKTVTWEQLDWTQCERRVRRLQARIVKVAWEIPALAGSVIAGL